MMICQAHWEPHAREEHADKAGSPSCFPHGSKPLAASGLATAATMLVTHSTGNRAEASQRRALNNFLNIVAPGHRVFLKFIDRLPEKLVTVDRTVWESIGEARIEFGAAFFNEGTVERCIRITAQALGRASRLDPEGVHKQIPMRSRPREGFLHSLAEIEAWAHGEIPDMTDQALKTWIPERASRTAVKRLAHALSYPAPVTVDGIAEWLLDAHEEYRRTAQSLL
ncbi:MAG: hypothetical protein ABR543_03750 [Gemmatimonadaceae bacterium]